MTAALVRAGAPIAFFCEIDTSPQAYAWSGHHVLEYESKVYLPVGSVGAVSETITNAKAQADGFEVGFHVSQRGNEDSYADFVAAVMEDRKLNVRGAPIRLYYAVFSDNQISGGLKYISGGVCSHFSVDMQPGSTTMALRCESRLAKALSHTSSLLSYEDQKRRYPNDEGLEYLALQAGGLALSWDSVA